MKMNLDEINNLIKEVFGCSLKESKDIDGMFMSVPNRNIHDAESKGYKYCIKKTLINEPSRNCIKSIVEKHKLRMKESQEYLVIYTPRKTSL
jgi:hypothetical protein